MPALFHPTATPRARRALAGAVVVALLLPVALMAWVRTPWARGTHVVVHQPIPFSHPLHAGTLKIDCRFCHSEVEWSAHAGMPPTDRCVTCHTPAWQATAALAPVRASLMSSAPIPWRRVTQLPQFVYFNHAMHVRHGVGCETCHGNVTTMQTVHQVAPLTMTWCVTCHRNPEPSLRPQAAITATGWSPLTLSAAARRSMLAEYNVHHYTNCSTCHR